MYSGGGHRRLLSAANPIMPAARRLPAKLARPSACPTLVVAAPLALLPPPSFTNCGEEGNCESGDCDEISQPYPCTGGRGARTSGYGCEMEGSARHSCGVCAFCEADASAGPVDSSSTVFSSRWCVDHARRACQVDVSQPSPEAWRRRKESSSIFESVHGDDAVDEISAARWLLKLPLPSFVGEPPDPIDIVELELLLSRLQRENRRDGESSGAGRERFCAGRIGRAGRTVVLGVLSNFPFAPTANERTNN